MDTIVFHWVDPLTGIAHHQQFTLPVRIGRRSSNDLVLRESQVSRCHAEVRRIDGNIVITDLQTTNGTYVNNCRVGEVTLAEGMVLRIGATYLTFGRGNADEVADELVMLSDRKPLAIEVGGAPNDAKQHARSFAEPAYAISPDLLADTEPNHDWSVPVCLGAGSVRDLAWSAQGDFFALATSLGVALRSASSFELIGYLPTSSPVTQVALSGDGSLLTAAGTASISFSRLASSASEWSQCLTIPGMIAAAAQGNFIGLDVHTNVDILKSDGCELVASLPICTTAQRRSLALSPDKRSIAAVTEAGIQIWQIATSTLCITLPADVHTIQGMAFSHDSRLLAIANEQMITFWDLQEHSQLYIIKSEQKIIGPLWFSANDQFIAAICTQKVFVWQIDNQTPTPLACAFESTPVSLAFNTSSNKIAIATSTDVYIWDILNNNLGSYARRYQASVTAVAVGAHGQVAASCGNNLRIWQHGREYVSFQIADTCQDHVYQLAFDASEKHLIATYADRAELWSIEGQRKIDIVTGQYLHSGTASFFRNGHETVWVAPDAIVGAAFTQDYAAPEYQPLLDVADIIATAPKADRIALVYNNTLAIYALSDGQHICNLELGGLVNDVAFSDDGRCLAIAQEQAIELWSLGEEYQCQILTPGAEQLIISPDTALLAAISGLNIRVWQIDTGAELTRFTGHTDRISGLAFSPDCLTLVSGSYDGTVRIWPLESVYEGASAHER